MRIGRLPITRALVFLDPLSALLLLIAVFCLLVACVFWLSAPSQGRDKGVAIKGRTDVLPHSFRQPTVPWNRGPLATKAAAFTLQLPDLKEEIIFLGCNGRPDAPRESRALQISLGERAPSISLRAGEPLYLIFDRKTSGSYLPSAHNAPTNLWITATPLSESEIRVGVDMAASADKPLFKDPSRTMFVVKKLHNVKQNNWSLGKHRVDGGLMARLRARWFGKDLFFAKHGGPEYSALVDKQRIDFGEGETRYSIYVGVGDHLIWKEEHWQLPNEGEDTALYPLLELSKIDDKLLVFDLWHPEGLEHVRLSLMRSRDLWMPAHAKEALRFAAARTWSQFVLDTGAERLEVRPKDWLLLQDGSWRLLRTVEEIDAYIQQNLQGELLVLSGVEQNADEQMLVGHLFNCSRSDLQQVQIPLASEGNAARLQGKGGARFLAMDILPSASMTPMDRREEVANPVETREPLAHLPKVMRGSVQRELEHAG